MIFTRPLLSMRRKGLKFGNQDLPRLDRLPKDKLLGMSRRRLCWTVIIVTIPLVVVFSNIVFRRLVLGEEKRKTFKEGGVDAAYLVGNLAGAPKLPNASTGKQEPKD